MTPSPPDHRRVLLCASAAHCAQILHAAAAARVNLHGLQPATAWPQNHPADQGLVLWALLPSPSAADHALEQQWRTRMLNGAQGFAIQMLYGSAQQQATQLAPWIPQRSTALPSPHSADCWECLDARSEQSLFQHLMQRT